jgi:threonine/homoserine/homoserine lactone efflux protein
MLGIHDLWLFIVSGLLLNVTPGPDTAYIVGRSVQFGWRGGAVATLGISSGCLVHVFTAAAGLSALLMASAAAFTALKLAGAAYLCFIGLTMLLSRAP